MDYPLLSMTAQADGPHFPVVSTYTSALLSKKHMHRTHDQTDMTAGLLAARREGGRAEWGLGVRACLLIKQK